MYQGSTFLLKPHLIVKNNVSCIIKQIIYCSDVCGKHSVVESVVEVEAL